MKAVDVRGNLTRCRRLLLSISLALCGFFVFAFFFFVFFFLGSLLFPAFFLAVYVFFFPMRTCASVSWLAHVARDALAVRSWN